MTSTREAMVETITAELFKHRRNVGEDGRAQCRCGWWVAPFLDSEHRAHQASEVLAAVMLATAQLNGENIVVARDSVLEEGTRRAEALGRLLISSGDITPMGARMLTKIFGPAEADMPVNVGG
jgi:hypothetical protein